MTFTPAVSKGITATFTGYFTNIPVEDIDLPSLKADAPLKTTHQTSANGYHEFIPAGFTDGGEASFKVQIDVTAIPPVNTQADLVVTFASPSEVHTYANAIFLEAPLGNGPLGQLFTGSMKFKVSGKPSVAGGS